MIFILETKFPQVYSKKNFPRVVWTSQFSLYFDLLAFLTSMRCLGGLNSIIYTRKGTKHLYSQLIGKKVNYNNSKLNITNYFLRHEKLTLNPLENLKISKKRLDKTLKKTSLNDESSTSLSNTKAIYVYQIPCMGSIDLNLGCQTYLINLFPLLRILNPTSSENNTIAISMTRKWSLSMAIYTIPLLASLKICQLK